MDANRQLGTSVSSNLHQRVSVVISDLVAKFQDLDQVRKRWLIGTSLFVLASAVGLVWYGSRTDWRTLYAGLDPQDAREMASELTAAGIPFDVSADGSSLRVDADHLDKARLVTTAKGGPRSGRMGFELFDKPNWIGSEFDEKVNYQRALEGELEHTIASLSDVERASVHLVMPHDSLFSDQQRDAKASVVLKLRRRTLSDEEGDSIRNLVSSAVDDLRPDNVVLVDSLGHQLGRRSGSAEVETHEEELATKLVETLEPIAGEGNVRASVNVEYDSSTADEVDETYDPNDVVTVSMQRSEQTAGGQPVAAGVPGTASNAPNVTPPVYPKAVSETQNLKQESGTYSASKKVRHTTQGPGKIRRITAAILVNHRMVTNGKRVSWQPRSPEEMSRITELAEATVGFDRTRGDTVSVEDMGFQDPVSAQATSFERVLKAATESEGVVKYGSILLAMLALLLFVVLPVIAKMKSALASQTHGSTAVPVLAAGNGETAMSVEQAAVEKRKQEAQAIFDQVADHLRREPSQSTRLLQSWIHTP